MPLGMVNAEPPPSESWVDAGVPSSDDVSLPAFFAEPIKGAIAVGYEVHLALGQCVGV